MAQTSITLTASMRSNLSSLKSIQSQMDKTQERLSTGKKVNSAIDNASSYYQSRALNNRAADLSFLLDSMGQGIQTIQAANEGLEAITSYVEQLKSVATSAYALDSSLDTYPDDLESYQNQYNAILKEIATLAKDSSYQGINLLKGNTLTVMFNETRSHFLEVKGHNVIDKMVEAGADGFSWELDAVTNMPTAGNISWEATEGTHMKVTTIAMETVTATDVQTDGNLDVAKLKSGVHFVLEGDKWRDAKAGDDVGDIKVKKGAEATELKTQAEADAIDNTATLMVIEKSDLVYDDAGNKIGLTSAEVIDKSLDAISDVTTYLRSYATELGNNFTIIETRQNFTEALVDVLETGADNLVLADMNEESANYLALQTRQQLAINSLSLASQSAQSVLKLF